MTKILLTGTALFLVLFVAGCEAPDPEARLKAMHLPNPAYRPDAEKGGPLFVRFCQSCHGVDARGTEQGPALAEPIYREKRHADLAFHLAVGQGVKSHHWPYGDMPPVQGISPEQTADVIAWIRRQQKS